MRFAGLLDMALFCVYVASIILFTLLLLPQAVYLFLTVNAFTGATAFIMVLIGLGWNVNQLRKMVTK